MSNTNPTGSGENPEAGRAEGGRTDDGQADGGRAEGGRAEGGRATYSPCAIEQRRQRQWDARDAFRTPPVEAGRTGI
ncbi:MAG: hypothetical protein ACRDLF_14310, partial [Solirubrobacteraceae bacterium]